VADPTFTYFLDKLGLGNEEDSIEIDREALHGKEVSAEVATVILLRQINSRLRDIELFMRQGE